MRYGITVFPTDRSIGILELARALEGAGLDSLWLPEHTHIPTSRKHPWPVDPTGRTPIEEKYKRSLDPLVALSAARPSPSASAWAPASSSRPSATPSSPPRPWPPSTTSAEGRLGSAWASGGTRTR